jgi:hypothetical protein
MPSMCDTSFCCDWLFSEDGYTHFKASFIGSRFPVLLVVEFVPRARMQVSLRTQLCFLVKPHHDRAGIHKAFHAPLIA